ncbi:MAG: hypothetical protein IPP15_01110 [Saprospiraceae bacterium]|uniref:Uncharacterized protein n=1 Tax=Candidatus Opimibacter skivensis TaxID=2982028 RepID=A0A9D7SU38_9BACT|nr:hypothetical protein [Candidatus Opimibacter skivensis]
MKNKLNFKQVVMAGLTAAAVSAIINSILFFAFKAVGSITDDVFIQPAQPLTVVPVIISSIVPTLIASLVFFFLEKYTQNGFRIFSIITIILMLLSVALPFTAIPNATTQYSLSLVPMHLVVPLVLLYFINKRKNSAA